MAGSADKVAGAKHGLDTTRFKELFYNQCINSRFPVIADHCLTMEASPLTQQSRPEIFQPKVVQLYESLFKVCRPPPGEP